MGKPSSKAVQRSTLLVAVAFLLAGGAGAIAQAQTSPDQPNQLHQADDGRVKLVDGELTVPSAGEVVSKVVNPDGVTLTTYADGSQLGTAPLYAFTAEETERFDIIAKLEAGTPAEAVWRLVHP